MVETDFRSAHEQVWSLFSLFVSDFTRIRVNLLHVTVQRSSDVFAACLHIIMNMQVQILW
jgi:hypothetical protein